MHSHHHAGPRPIHNGQEGQNAEQKSKEQWGGGGRPSVASTSSPVWPRWVGARAPRLRRSTSRVLLQWPVWPAAAWRVAAITSAVELGIRAVAMRILQAHGAQRGAVLAKIPRPGSAWSKALGGNFSPRRKPKNCAPIYTRRLSCDSNKDWFSERVRYLDGSGPLK